MDRVPPFLLGLCASVVLAASARAGDPAFEERYAFELARKGPLAPLDWTSGPADAWRVSGLEFVRGGELSFLVGEATLVVGAHARNPVWAVILPDRPASLAGRNPGAQGLVTAAFVRCAPGDFRELFPATRVTGPAPAGALLAERRIAQFKMGSSWQSDGFPAIPDARSWVLDCDTVEGTRRFFTIDDAKNAVQSMAAFERRVLPPDVPIEPAAALAAFDRAWSRFDEVYAKFVLRPEVDWDAVRATYRPLAESATTTWQAGTAIALAIEPLCDLHAWAKAGDEFCAPYQRVRPLNGSWNGARAVIGEVAEPARGVAHGRTKEGVAYVAVLSLSDPGCVDAFDAALEELGGCHALVLDLRFNGGGDESLAQAMAGRFADKPRVYSQSQFRADPKDRSKLGPKQPRTVSPRGPWKWGQPVVVLQGRRTMSSAESFAAMMSVLPGVTTMGDATAGSSGNPELLDLGNGIVVNVPRWNDLDAAGKPIEDVGIAPKVRFEPKPASFTSDSDALVIAGLDHLKKATKGVKRAGKPAKK